MTAIEQRPLGGSGLSVSAIGLGTAALAVPYGAPGAERRPPAADEARAAIAHALDAGITFIDTAPAYGDAERRVGEVAAGTGCTIATKIAVPLAGWAPMDDAAVREHVRRSAEASCRALRCQVLDVLQVHNADREVIERGAVPAAIDELRAEGIVRIGGATVYGNEDALAAVACPSFGVVQVAMSALDPRAVREVLPAAAESSTAVVARSVLLRGVLSAAGERLDGPFAPLRDAAAAFRADAGATWDELPGAAVAFAAALPGVASVLLGPRDAGELSQLLEGAGRFRDHVANLEPSWGAGLSADLLDPSRWPALERTDA